MVTAVKAQSASWRCRWGRGAIAAGIAGCAILFGAAIAAAQAPVDPPKSPGDAPAPAPPGAAPPTAAPPAAENPGLVGVFNTCMQQGVTTMSTGIDAMVGAAKGAADAASTVAKGAADAAKGAADAAKEAADVAVDGVTKWPGIASGHERCALAANGAPDCQAAAEALCRARGFSTGASVDYVTSENCPPAYRNSSHRPEGVCTQEHMVTRALCK
jgi:hypothetical protein